MNNPRKGFIVPLIIAVVVILVAGGVYMAWKGNTDKDTAIVNVQTPSPSIQSSSKTFTNQKYGFEIKYPTDFVVSETEQAGFFDETNIYNLSLQAPVDYQKNTDFYIARIDVYVSSSTAKCLTLSPNGETLSSSKLINGASFRYNPKQPFRDDAMGGVRGLDSLFASIHNGSCYRIDKLSAYRDGRGFTDPPYPSHFDEQKISDDLDAIISSFKYTN